jgi:translation initiation factor IF-2
MGKSNVEEFAGELGLPINLLLEQLKSSGVDKSSASDELKEEDKSALLAYLRSEHGASLRPKSKITLTRKQKKQIVKVEQEQFRWKLEKKELLSSLINPKSKIPKRLLKIKQ